MIAALIDSLIASENEAADDVLLECLELGNAAEQETVLQALIKRETVHGLSSVIERYKDLPEPLQGIVMEELRSFNHALTECGRSDNVDRRLAAMKLIAIGRLGKLAYVLSENLHESDEALSTAATEAMVALSRWVATDTRSLNRHGVRGPEDVKRYNAIIDNRTEIEAAVVRAMDLHRGTHGPELLRACLLLCDSPRSKTLAILHTARHGGQSPMVRRLQQVPASEHVEAYLLGGSHGQLRSHFGVVFSHIDEVPVLDAMLRRTHWLKDPQLQLCMHQVQRGIWWQDVELLRDIDRRTPEEAARIGDWIAASGLNDLLQDERLDQIRRHAAHDFPARLRLFRLAAARRRGSSVVLFKQFLTDPDERLVRMAAREIVRRRPADYESILLKLMTNAPESVRKVVSRAIGQIGFDHFWNRFDRMDRATRKQAGRAMMKLLPDAQQRLARQLATGPVEQRTKALQIVQDLGLCDAMRVQIISLCTHPHPRVRSKAVSALGEIPEATTDTLLRAVLNDEDGRVRANAIEVLETTLSEDFMPLLAERARSTHNRERANAIKAMHKMRVSTAIPALSGMLQDQRPEHRISALWAMRQIGFWQMLNQVGQIAKADNNLRVRRYALGVLKGVVDVLNAEKKAKNTA